MHLSQKDRKLMVAFLVFLEENSSENESANALFKFFLFLKMLHVVL